MKNIALLSLVIPLMMSISCQNKSKTASKEDNADQSFIQESAVSIKNAQALEIIDSSASLELLASGFWWSEGPLWVDELNAVLFSDVPRNVIYKWTEKDSLTVYLTSAGHSGQGNESSDKGPNGLLLNDDRKLMICQHGDRRIALLDAELDNPEKQFKAIADNYAGKPFNSPNDLTMDEAGNIYFTDPPYGQDDNKTGEIGMNGVYKVKPDGEVVLLVDSLKWPNGIALSPDEKYLYINQSDPENSVLYRYEFDAEGKLINGLVFFDSNLLTKEAKGLPDGLKVHSSGNIFATGPGGVLIISPEGQHLATINTGKRTANCAFDSDEKYLYMTSTDLLLRIPLKQ